LFCQVSSLLLQQNDLLHDVYEHATLQQGLASIVLKSHDHDLHAETLLGVPDAINEVTVTRKESDTVDVGTESVINEVNGYSYVDLSLHFPLDLFLATTSALR
jgi:hypothetical protein